MSTTVTAPATSELVRFLLARLDEDEATLKRRNRHVASAPDRPADGVDSPNRLYAEALAKRRVIGTVQQLLVLRDQPAEKPVRDAAAQILRSLAAPYEGHVGFRNEWRLGKRH